MTHPSVRKGATFEREVARFLVEHGHPHAERAYGAGGADDRGDVDGLPGFVVQCRNTKRLDLAGALDDAEAQREREGCAHAVAVVKRRGHPVARAYVVMTLEQFAALTAEEAEASR